MMKTIMDRMDREQAILNMMLYPNALECAEMSTVTVIAFAPYGLIVNSCWIAVLLFLFDRDSHPCTSETRDHGTARA